MLLDNSYTPPFAEAATFQFDSEGVTYNETRLDEKFVVFQTNLAKKSRGISLKILESEHWIDIVTLALKQEVKIISRTHAGKEEPWFKWNDEGHKHDAHGAALRVVNDTNRLMAERGVTHILIDTTNYTGDTTWKFQVMQEQIVRTAFWDHYVRIQGLSGILSFALQAVKNFGFDSTLTYAGVAAVLVFSALEKVDFVKDIQVAWSFPHASPAYMFVLWLSITIPTFSVFFYFLSIGSWEKFLPSFFGYAELLREAPEGEAAGDFMDLVRRQDAVMDGYNTLLPRLAKEEKRAGRVSLQSRREMYAGFEEAALISLDIQATIRRRIARFMVAGFVILVENSL